jgi:surface protein
MFTGASVFNQDISSWDTGLVQNMSYMFEVATSFNNGGVALPQVAGKWDTSNVNDMSVMFDFATAFNQDIGSWNISSVTNALNMLDASGITIDTYNSILNGWANNGYAPTGLTIGVIGLSYSQPGLAAHNKLGTTSSGLKLNSSVYNWTFVGDTYSGPVPCYNKGTMIKIVENGVEFYRTIEELKPGDLVRTYCNGDLPIEIIVSGKMTNNPNGGPKCMYRMNSGDFGDLIVTGGHGILKSKISMNEYLADKKWFDKNQLYSRINKHFLVRAMVSPEFTKITEQKDFIYYHLALKGNPKRRYGIWANGILSESTFKKDLTH